MEKSKKTMLVAALAVAFVALAGAGYATSYTAKTTNEDNAMDATYIQLSQAGTAKYSNFLKNIYFDTVNTSEGVYEYAPVADYDANAASSPTSFTSVGSTAPTNPVALASKGLQLFIDPVKNAATSVSFTVTASNFTPVNGLKYTLILGTSNTDETTGATTITAATGGSSTITGTASSTAADNTWSFTGVPISATQQTVLSVFLFIYGDASAGSTGFPASDAAAANQSDFVFTLKADA